MKRTRSSVRGVKATCFHTKISGLRGRWRVAGNKGSTYRMLVVPFPPLIHIPVLAQRSPDETIIPGVCIFHTKTPSFQEKHLRVSGTIGPKSR